MGADFGWEYPAGVTSKDIDAQFEDENDDPNREDDEDDIEREKGENDYDRGGEYAR